jgi:hypothetical protein
MDFVLIGFFYFMDIVLTDYLYVHIHEFTFDKNIQTGIYEKQGE